ncbi:RING finger protein 122 [Nymphaea thermarum]|nr:RING finger protein 122 [Nymphaea thermarum]
MASTAPLALLFAVLLLAGGGFPAAVGSRPPFSCDPRDARTRSFPFCSPSLPLPQRVRDLLGRPADAGGEGAAAGEQVIDEDSEVTKSQLCYEQKIVTRYSTQICDPSYVEQLAYSTLHDDMDMDPKAAEKAKAEVGRTIMNKMEVARNGNPSLWTVFMVIRVYCAIEISDEKGGESSGEHGYDRLLKCLGDDDCSICREEFKSTDHILVTTCHHTFHLLCLFEWLSSLPMSCPLCRSDLSPIFGGAIKF